MSDLRDASELARQLRYTLAEPDNGMPIIVARPFIADIAEALERVAVAPGDDPERLERLADLIARKRVEVDRTIVLHMRPRGPWWSRAAHNCLAHPLLILCPPLGEWLHERT